MPKFNLPAFAAVSVASLAFAASTLVSHAEKPERVADILPASVSSYILLDRTGSMSGIWQEAVSSVNAYADEINKSEAGEAKVDADITLAVFDHYSGFKFNILRNTVDSENWQKLSVDEVSPRGSTPLFDAINRMIIRAEEDAPERAIIVIMTDGHENASEEVTRQGVKAALGRVEKRGWEVVFLGAEFASFGDAEALGISSDKSMAIGKDNLSRANRGLAAKVKEFARAANPEEAQLTFDEKDRAEAGEQDVIDRKGQ